MNWLYIAGFFDGEGCIARNRTSEPLFKYWQISIAQTQKDVLNQIQRFIGYGKIYQENHVYPQSTVYILRIAKQEKILDFLSNVLPHIIVKRKQVQEILADPWIHPRERKVKMKEVTATKLNSSIQNNEVKV